MKSHRLNCGLGPDRERHIYPLFGVEVSGLHVAENLQWLPAVENARKGNRIRT